MRDYGAFLADRDRGAPVNGFEPGPLDRYQLAPFQRDLVSWALRRGRAAVFADTGLGKSRMQLAWASEIDRQRGGDVLILAPLAVAAQTQREAERIGVRARVVRDGSEVEHGISITNYDRLHRFDVSRFAAVVCDESSVLKHHDAKTFLQLTEAFAETPYRLCATATPAPNDYTELGTHAEFLGVCRRTEMLSEYFVHDGGETQVWRLKGHARSAFWRWVASWGALVRRPSDLGHDDTGYVLPDLIHHSYTVAADAETYRAQGLLFAIEAQSLVDRRRARQASVSARVERCAAVVAADPDEPWIVWCDLNAESEALASAIPGAVEVRGSDDIETKEERLIAFADGRIRVLVSKPSICGWGLNWQHCARMAFVGVTDSYEAYYQAVRRCWRFGQTRPVHVHVFASEAEGAVVTNLERKAKSAEAMAAALAQETQEAVRSAVCGAVRSTTDYKPTKRMEVPAWLKSR